MKTLDEIAAMSADEKNVAIAELCGWKKGSVETNSFADPTKTITNSRWISPNGFPSRRVPDYSASLDAMAQAEATLNGDLLKRYGYYLTDIAGERKDASWEAPRPEEMAMLNTDQRATAFIFTMQK